MPDGPILQGKLGLRKKKGVEDRFFLLFENRLDYYSTKLDADSRGPPRGHLDFQEVDRAEATAEGLLIHNKDGGVISLHTYGDVRWAGEMDKLLRRRVDELQEHAFKAAAKERGLSKELDEAMPLWQGYLAVRHKGEHHRRFFVLLDDALIYYLEKEDWSAGKEPRGACVLSEVTGFEDSMNGFSLKMKGHQRPLQVRAPNEADLDMWLRHLRAVLEPELGSQFVLHRSLEAEAAAEGHVDMAVPPEVTGLGEKERLGEQEEGEIHAQPLFEGSLDHMKGGKHEMRYFVLFEDRFDYFSKAEDFRNRAPPRGSVMVNDICGVEISDQGSLILQLANRRFELRTVGERPEVQARGWGDAWEKALAGPNNEAHDVAEHSKRAPMEEAPSTQRLHKGLLSVRRRGQLEDRFALLFTDRLELFLHEEAARVGEEPRTRLALGDVERFEVREGWLFLQVHERTLEFFAGGAASTAEAWKTAIEEAMSINCREDLHSSSHATQSTGKAAVVDGGMTVEHVLEAVSTMLRDRRIRARDLFQDPRYNPSKDDQLDARTFQQICSEAGLVLSLAETQQMLRSLSKNTKNKIDLGEFEASLRSHRRSRSAEDSEKEGNRRLRLVKRRPEPQQNQADDEVQEANAVDPVERARTRLRAATHSGGGVNWAKAFTHYSHHHRGGIDVRGFATVVRRVAKITRTEVPDGVLDKVFALVDTAGTGMINHSDVWRWLGIQEEASLREEHEEQAAVRTQAAQSGRKARTKVGTVEERGPRKLREGNFMLEGQGGRTETRHLIVYEDRLEFTGRHHGHRIMAVDIEDVEVLDHGFVLCVRGAAPIRLRALPGLCMEEWLDALSRVCGEDQKVSVGGSYPDWDEDMPWSSEGEGPGDSQASTAASAAGLRRLKVQASGQDKAALPAGARGGPLEASGQGKSRGAGLRSGGVERQRSPPRLRSPGGAQPSAAPDAPPALQTATGHGTEAARADVGWKEAVVAPSAPSPDRNAGAARSMPSSPSRPCSPSRSARPVREGSPGVSTVSPRAVSDRSPPMSPRFPPVSSIDTRAFREPPVHFGILGFEDSGGVVPRFSVLFQDRIDSWESQTSATSGQPPRGRIALCDVRGIEMVRGGFILNCKGRKVELFVDSNDGASEWSGALHSVILSQYSPLRERPRGGVSKSFIPRVATLPQSARQHSPGSATRVTMLSGRAPQRDGVRINTHRDGLQASMLLHGKEVLAFPHGQKDIAGKVNQRVSALEGSPEPSLKVTGQRHISPRRDGDLSLPSAKITGERLFSPRRELQPISGKITGVREHSPDCRCLPENITDVGREAHSRTRSPSPSLMGKITDAGGDRVHAGHYVSDLDKIYPFGFSPSFHRTSSPQPPLERADGEM